MEDVKWLLKKWGFPILILLIAVIAGVVCWGKLHTDEKKVAEEVWELPVEIKASETITEEENDMESFTDSAYWFIPQSSDCLILEEEKEQLVTLIVDRVWPDYNSDFAFRNTVVVQPFQDGTFRYLSNSIEQIELELPEVAKTKG